MKESALRFWVHSIAEIWKQNDFGDPLTVSVEPSSIKHLMCPWFMTTYLQNWWQFLLFVYLVMSFCWVSIRLKTRCAISERSWRVCRQIQQFNSTFCEFSMMNTEVSDTFLTTAECDVFVLLGHSRAPLSGAIRIDGCDSNWAIASSILAIWTSTKRANGITVTERSANALLARRSLSERGQRGHERLLFEQWFSCVFLPVCVRHRGTGGVFLGAGVSVSNLRCWVVSWPPAVVFLLTVCAASKLH